MRRFVLPIVIAATLLSAFLGDAAHGQTRRSIKLPHTYLDATLNPLTGDLIVIDPLRDAVDLFKPATLPEGDATPAASAVVGRLPVGVAFKQVGGKPYILVLCGGDNTLRVLDPALKEVKSIPLSGTDYTSLTVSVDPADPFAYYTAMLPVSHGSLREVACVVDLTTLSDLGRFELGESEVAGPLSVSADGTYLYVSRSGSSILRPFRIERQGTGVKATQLSDEQQSFGAYVVDSTGTFCATGTDLWNADLATHVAKLPAHAVCFVPNEPILLGTAPYDYRFQEDEERRPLIAVSVSTYKKVGQVKLPDFIPQRHIDDWLPLGDDGKSLPIKLRFIVSAKDRHVLIHYKDQLEIIPLSDFKYAIEPSLVAEVRVPPLIWQGEPIEIPLALQPGVEATLAQGPEGMTLDNNRVRWTPPADFLGVETVQLAIRGGGIESTQNLTLTVARRHVDLGFIANHLVVSPDHRWAAVCSDASYFGGRARDSIVALVDLEKQNIVAHRKLDTAVRAVAMDSRRVYVAMYKDNALRVLHAADLRDEQQIPLERPVLAMKVAGDFLVTQDEKETRVYACADLKLVLAFTERIYRHPDGPPAIYSIEGGTTVDRIVFSPDFKLIHLLYTKATLDPWNRVTHLQQFQDALGQRISDIGRLPVIHPQRPIMGTLVGMGPSPTVDLLLHELVNGGVKARISLCDVSQIASGHLGFVWAGDTAVVTASHRLYTHRLTPEQLALFPTPMILEPRQSVVVLDPRKKNILKHTPRHAKGGVTFKLEDATNGFDVDAKTGDVTVDAPAILAQLSTFTIGKKPIFSPSMIGVMTSPEYRQREALLEKMVNRKLSDDLLLAIRVTITATDAQQQSAPLSYVVMLPVSPTILKQHVARSAQPHPQPRTQP